MKIFTRATVSVCIAIILYVMIPYGYKATTPHNYTPLMGAIIKRDFEKANQLIDSGADIHVKESWGHNALFYAVSANNYALVKKLLDHQADVVIGHNEGNLLNYAATLDNTDPRIFELLIIAGADVNSRISGKEGTEPLYLALRNPCKPYAVIEVLLRHGADPTSTVHGMNAFVLAKNMNDKALVDILKPYEHVLNQSQGSRH